MNCRSFENQVADWLAGRLAPKQAARIAGHRQACPSCSRAAEAEERLRAEWRALAASPAPDFWPRLASRLEDPRRPQARPRVTTARRRTWAWGGTALLTTMAVSGMLLWPKPVSTTQHTGDGRLTLVRPVATVSALPDVSRVDPAVDDPAGTSMENVWTQINAAVPGADSQ